ncbi:MAG: IS66 family transposase [Pirellulaceae bacterium]
MMMKRTEPDIIEIKAEELQETLQHAETAMSEKDYERIKAVFEAYAYVTDELGKKRVAVGRLQKLLFGAKTEKTEAVVGAGTDADSSASSGEEPPAESTQETDPESKASKKRKGHGRNGADAYDGAEKIPVPHPSLEAGDDCPDCQTGTVYNMAQPRSLVRLVGQAPVKATVFQLQRLRCGLCGKVFTAPLPDGVGAQKYDATTGSIIGVLKYGSGMPFNRLEGLQGSFGIPLPASTQWDIVADVFLHIEPAVIELSRQAAQGDVLYNDDTVTKILDLMGKRAKKNASAKTEQDDSTDEVDPSRTGLFTSCIVSTQDGRRIALFFSGRRHAGENLAKVLAERAEALAPPIQMCDALSRNLPGELETIVANCLAHGRRRFADVSELFPDECKHVLLALKVIYKNDEDARKQKLSPEERLKLHQAESRSTMDDLHSWLNRQLDERLVEPNSALGEAITYMLKHWTKLTLFLRKAGAPLDNNICERALKKAILHRKNSMFFKSKKGARTGDAFMSLIYTCELNGTNPFDYLTELQRHAKELAAAPHNWMPWNYRATLAAITTPSVPVC